MTVYECWEKGCKENESIVRQLETESNIPESGVFSVTSSYWIHGYRFFRTPVFFVWWNGKEIFSGMSYQEALNAWRELT